jgi:hypothetical protein
MRRRCPEDAIQRAVFEHLAAMLKSAAASITCSPCLRAGDCSGVARHKVE